ncbi:MAG: ribosomal RNA small subunit methyltransferase A [Peptococcaceae bacterium]|mgnify:CR=1 FL=1|nr:ribosomal RNA small subunit methyltransferase A [Peptococcaceae bacterium]
MTVRLQESAAHYTRRVLRNGGSAKKSLGQNFLIDDQIIANIIEKGLPDKNLPVLEVGPGPGALTRVLVTRTKRLWAVELDKEKIEILRKEILNKGCDCQFTLMHMDARKLFLKDIWGHEKGWLIGNLPYYITNLLLQHFLEQAASLYGMTVMVQKEVAQRMTAGPGSRDYGILSIAIQLAAEAEILFDVPPAAFWPQPKVTSSVVKLNIRPYPGFMVDQQDFFRVVRAAFAQRRKTLLNALTAGLKLPKESVQQVLQFLDFPLNIRPEELGILDYQRVVLALKKVDSE